MKDREEPDSMIPETMIIVGDIRCRGLARIDGTIDGRMCGERVILGPSGRISGEIEVEQLDCFGTLDGHVAAQQLQLQPSARVKGTVAVEELSVVAGATIDAVVGGTESGSLGSLTVDEGGGDVVSAPLTNRNEERGIIVAAKPVQAAVLDSLAAALQGGSRLVVVLSAHTEERTCFIYLAQRRFAPSHQVITILNPRGSVRDLLCRIAEQQEVPVSEDDDVTNLGAAVRREFGRSGTGLLLIENAETMFPATLEGLLRLLSELPSASVPQVILSGGPDLRKIQDVQPSGAMIWEPDCLFELPDE